MMSCRARRDDRPASGWELARGGIPGLRAGRSQRKGASVSAGYLLSVLDEYAMLWL